jgi:hypothetical protein
VRPDEPFDLLDKASIARTLAIQPGVPLVGRSPDSCVKEVVQFLPAGGVHARLVRRPFGRGMRRSPAIASDSQAREKLHSRSTVAIEICSASPISFVVKPPKNFSSTDPQSGT